MFLTKYFVIYQYLFNSPSDIALLRWPWTFLAMGSLSSQGLKTGKCRRRRSPVKTVAAAWLLCCFWLKTHKQAMTCELVHYRGATLMTCCFTIPDIFSHCFTQTVHNFKIIFPIDCTIFWQVSTIHDAIGVIFSVLDLFPTFHWDFVVISITYVLSSVMIFSVN